MEEYVFITFDSTNFALQAEDYLKKNNFSVTIIPTPREVTQSCGLSIRLNSAGIDEVKEIIGTQKIKIKSIYFLKKENGFKKIEEVKLS
ncbi:hypothetical protein OXPF_37050 [Oxobacter pfennigii]|uniref:Putative Se/S carrier protein-like domain-containing protein n=1 Tax=Oxobacter pfennigii TaxID=36849 RepID=A0A0N8NST6_9CLOT|nr:DUF3343 domain-containing protein [Oxobacter pfennigii]KPU42936.1 hypothetical protein OXPF_37050 [Oxobacter pfennigii]